MEFAAKVEGFVILRKYPRTPHLPWSPGVSNDDVRAADVSAFVGHEVVVTEKMDGECTTIYRGGCHARSIDSGPHPSRERVKALAGRVGHQLPEDWRIVGENIYAMHSIAYSELPDYFLAFGLHVGSGLVVGWDRTVEECERRGIKTVPVLYRGPWDEEKVRACWTGKSQCGGEQEGYVVRVTDAFVIDLFPKVAAKYVRPGHVQTDEHWMRRSIMPNKVRR